MKSEPVLIGGGVISVVAALMSWIRLMNWVPMDKEQWTSFEMLVGTVITMAISWWTRSKVTPVDDPRTRSGQPATLEAKPVPPEGR